jgi:serine/threonine-protein kinase
MVAPSPTRLQELFAAAVALDPPRRAAFLESECGDDAALLAEVQGLLAADERLGAATARSAVRDLPTWFGIDARTAEGTRVGAYELREELGRGGMGCVYRAVRVDGQVTQEVAIKFVRRETLDEHTRRRFQLERNLLAALDHPHIARLLDADELDDGTPYYVMEYVAGAPIDAYCTQAGLSVRERVALVGRLCDAVAQAHRNLVVHRDLKPSNVLVSAAGVPKLLDFGIAKPLDAPPSEQTGTAQRYFSPSYAAPEQVVGGPIGVGCDVYGLGLLLYELLAGARPFEFDALTPGQVERLITQVPPPLPSATAARQPATAGRARQLRGDLDGIVMRCLRKAPGERYASVEQLQADLDNYLAGRPVAARGGHALYRLRKFVGRNAIGVAAAALGAVALVGFVAALTVQARRLEAERDGARRERDRADQVARFLTDVFESADPTVSLSRETSIGTALDNGRRRIADLGDAPTRVRLALTLARVYAGIDDDEAAAALLDEIAPMFVDDGDVDPRVRAEYYLRRGQVLNRQGKFAESRELAEKSIALHRSLGDPPSVFAEAVELQVDDAGQLGDEIGKIELHRAFITELRADPQTDHATLASFELSFGHYLAVENRVDEAEPLLRAALERLRAAGRTSDEPLLLAGNVYLADLLDFGRKRSAEAIALLETTKARQSEIYGHDSSAVAHTLNAMGNAHAHLEQYDLALARFEEARAIYRKIHARPHSDHMAIAFNLAGIHDATGDLDRAADMFGEALEVIESIAPDSQNAAITRGAIGLIRLRQGRVAEAASILGAAVERVGLETPRVLNMATGYLDALIRLGRHDEARDLLARVAPLAEAHKDAMAKAYEAVQKHRAALATP